jgi:hypothetical protein
MKKPAKLTAALAALFSPEANARNAGDAERVISKLLNPLTDGKAETNAAVPEAGRSNGDQP